jgi:cellulose synthase/poly-beta-1,6-N-acetylglucosamine synthase-like glycosyltransferase
LFKYKSIYAVAGFFLTRKFPPAKKQHKYAVLVAARNEEKVIGHLIDSVRAQDYPADLVTIFVVADNCSEGDHTAEIARAKGAFCYERHDTEHKTKGFALQFLVECIRKDFGIDAFEGYFVFDADNLLKEDFISRMNESFDAGEKIITSYRNTKNFGDNWISASYGIHWLRTVRYEHRARSFFHLATRIQGTGFLFANEVIKDGWNYTSLTEDRAFCADAVANGYKISFNNAAEFFDEQPVDIKIAMRQRIRWAKGHLQAFVETGGKLFSHIFVTHGAANKMEASAKGISVEDIPKWKRFVNNIRLRFMSFDMLAIVYPRSVVSSFKKVIIFILRSILIYGGALYVTTNFAPGLFKAVLSFFGLSIEPSGTAAQVLLLSLCTFLFTVNTYLLNILTAAYIFIIEHKRIAHIVWYKKVWFCITFPIFGLIGNLSTIIALFSKVEWKPIPHNAAMSLNDVNNKKQKSNNDK